jgi:hypothetical protein
MLQPETNVAVVVATLMVVAERVAAGFSRRLVDPAAREYASSSLNSHHGCAGAGVFEQGDGATIKTVPLSAYVSSADQCQRTT